MRIDFLGVLFTQSRCFQGSEEKKRKEKKGNVRTSGWQDAMGAGKL
jgi:hypothetical protein